MSLPPYPPVRYAAPSGEVSAVLRPAAAPPDLVTDRTQIAYLATAASTAGELGLYRYSMTAAPSGPAPHFHRTISESFFVLAGTVRLFDGQRWLDGTAGDFLHVPVGGVHAFRNDSGKPADMLILFTPGAPREAYFEALVERAASGRSFDDDERAEFLRSHDQYDA